MRPASEMYPEEEACPHVRTEPRRRVVEPMSAGAGRPPPPGLRANTVDLRYPCPGESTSQPLESEWIPLGHPSRQRLVVFRAHTRCVPKARWFRRRRSTGHRACCASDGGRPSGLAVTGGESKPPQAASGQKALVVSVAARGPLPAGQVCDEKTSMCKPLRTHRNAQRRHQNRGSA